MNVMGVRRTPLRSRRSQWTTRSPSETECPKRSHRLPRPGLYVALIQFQLVCLALVLWAIRTRAHQHVWFDLPSWKWADERVTIQSHGDRVDPDINPGSLNWTYLGNRGTRLNPT